MPRALELNYYARRRAIQFRERIQAEFPTPRLAIELVPEPCWGRTLCNRLKPAVWEMVRERTLARGNLCEVCGDSGDPHRRECHEVWEYQDELLVQRLARVLALCPRCHHAKHLGLSILRGLWQESSEHLQAVNGWSYATFDAYFALHRRLYEYRSANSWSQNNSWLADEGFPFIPRTRAPRVRFPNRAASAEQSPS